MLRVEILYPMCALAGLTGAVLLLIPLARFRAVAQGAVTARDFALGESARVPEATRIPNRNFMNLLEVPLLFYVVSLSLYVTDTATSTALALAWIYVALRAVHSAIHLTYNHVIHRLAAFATSNFVLVALWILFTTGLR